jgi:hypothetical protein
MPGRLVGPGIARALVFLILAVCLEFAVEVNVGVAALCEYLDVLAPFYFGYPDAAFELEYFCRYGFTLFAAAFDEYFAAVLQDKFSVGVECVHRLCANDDVRGRLDCGGRGQWRIVRITGTHDFGVNGEWLVEGGVLLASAGHEGCEEQRDCSDVAHHLFNELRVKEKSGGFSLSGIRIKGKNDAYFISK